MHGLVNARMMELKIKSMTDGQLINQHGYQLWLAIEEDWKNEPYAYLNALGAELRRRNDQ